MHGNHAVATPHRSRTVVALAVLMLCLGQLGACSSTSGPPSPAGPLLLAERHTWGGMCPEGPCRSALAISDDGAWTWSDEAADSQGRISPRDHDELIHLAAALNLPSTQYWLAHNIPQGARVNIAARYPAIKKPTKRRQKKAVKHAKAA